MSHEEVTDKLQGNDLQLLAWTYTRVRSRRLLSVFPQNSHRERVAQAAEIKAKTIPPLSRLLSSSRCELTSG